jgi:hypothetical protein
MTSVEQQLRLPVDPQKLTTSSLIFGARLLENSNPRFQVVEPGSGHAEKVAIPSPLKIGGKEIVPLTDRVFSKADQFYALFYAYHAKPGESGRPRLKLTASIWDASGAQLSEAPPIPFSEIEPDSGGVPCHVRFQLSRFLPGKYVLKLALEDEVGQEGVRLEEPFEVR